MEANLGVVFRTAATQHVFRHSPVGTFHEYRYIINIYVEGISFFVIRIFLYAESHILGFRNLSVHFYFKGTSV